MRKRAVRAEMECGKECLEARRHLHRLLDARVTPARRREVLRHLKGCRGCFTLFELAGFMRRLIRSAVCTECCPSALERRVRKAVRASS